MVGGGGTVTGPSEWHAQQIAEFLAAVSAYEDEPAALDGAVERAAEAVEAEVAAVVRDGEVLASVGFRAGHVPTGRVVIAAAGGVRARHAWNDAAGAGAMVASPVLQVAGVGACATVTVPVDGTTTLLVARSGDPFASEEALLLRGMGRVLAQALRMLRALDNERTLRLEALRHMEENQRLVTVLQERQTLLERLFRIQRSISHRMPVGEVLDSITEGAVDLLGDDLASLRVLDETDPGRTILLSSIGIDPVVMHSLQHPSVEQGLSGQAILQGRLVMAEHYGASPHSHPALASYGICSAMAAPVSRNGEIVGSLLVGSFQRRRYSPAEQEVLLAFAEHASLALNDAAAVEGMRRAFDDAVHQATHDPLTGLPNRSLVLDRLDQALSRSGRTGGRVTVLFADLDRFKVVNDSFGHSAGDGVLLCVSERLRAAVRPHDTVGRLAGDEFVVVCEDLTDREAIDVAERVAAAVSEPIQLGGRESVITASIGIAHAEVGTRAEDMLRDSDVAMYGAKERGRSRIELFDAEMRRRMIDRLEMERALRSAITAGELRLHYQPIVSFDDWRVTAAEALVRWEHPERGVVDPAEFIPLAEESGLIVALDDWVMRTACAQVRAWTDAGLPPLRMAVNLSGRAFWHARIVERVIEVLAITGVDPEQLELEVTESMAVDSVADTRPLFRELEALGVRLAIDDFGTGYSALGRLQGLPFHTLKIDRSFVARVENSHDEAPIVAAMIAMAHALKMEVVAEGVETEAQHAFLARHGCDIGQGYLFARPLVPAAVAELLASPVPAFQDSAATSA